MKATNINKENICVKNYLKNSLSRSWTNKQSSSIGWITRWIEPTNKMKKAPNPKSINESRNQPASEKKTNQDKSINHTNNRLE